MQRTNFIKNWNHKLLQDNFGTVRLADQEKYYKDAEHEIFLDDVRLGIAKIYTIRSFRFSDIRDALAWIDSGMPAVKFAAMLKSMYKNKIEGGVQPETVFYHIIYHWNHRELKAFTSLANGWWASISDSFYQSSSQQDLLSA